MASKGIPTRPTAKRINKLPLVIVSLVLTLIVVTCFWVVTKRQNRLQKDVATAPVIETAPINADTQTPEFLQAAYLKNLDETTRQEQNAKEQITDRNMRRRGKTNAPAVEQGGIHQPQTILNKPPQKPVKIRESLEKPFQPYYQATQHPPAKPQKSEAQLFREKVASQKREAALQALRAPTLVNISTAPSKQQIPSDNNFLKNNQYPSSQIAVPPQEQPDQKQKRQFLDTAAESVVSLANAYHKAGSLFELKQGHLIPITLITKINSDLPGRIKAQVTENVYDTATGNYLLIPQGTMVNGIYDSRVVFGQKRVLIAWQRLIFPDGSSLNVGSMPGTDQEGSAGFKDLVDNHYFQIFGSAILMSVVNAGFTVVSETDTNATEKETAQDVLAKSAAQQMQQVFSKMIDKIMAIQPELIIRQGKQGHIILTKDVTGLKPYNPAQKPTYFLKTVEVQ